MLPKIGQLYKNKLIEDYIIVEDIYLDTNRDYDYVVEFRYLSNQEVRRYDEEVFLLYYEEFLMMDQHYDNNKEM